jgi:glycosyltransferase involved in cell wall biosynthesis
MSKLDVSLIISCYNEGRIFKDNVKKVVSELKNTGKNWEIIFIEDKSADKTRKTVSNLVEKNKWARAIYHSRNMGRGRSVSDGIKKANGKICGFLDIDLEVSPSYIPIFISEIERGAELVVGKRFYERSLTSLSRVVASRVYSFIVDRIIKLPIEDSECGYKFFERSKIVPVLKKTKDNGWFWDTEICARAHLDDLKIREVPVLFKRRHDKKSTVRLIPDSFDYFRKLIRFRSEIIQNEKR